MCVCICVYLWMPVSEYDHMTHLSPELLWRSEDNFGCESSTLLLCCYLVVRCCINLTDSQGASGASPLCASHLLGGVLGLNRQLHYRSFYSILLLRGNLNSGFKPEGQAPLPIQPDLLSSSFIFIFIIVDKHLLWRMLWNFPNIIELWLPGQQFLSSQERKVSLFTSRRVVPF